MSVPPDRMAVRSTGDPNKIMGLPKWAFWAIIVVGLILAYYIYKRSQSASNASLQTANAGTEPDTTNGVTAADIGGTPADNSFATVTDEQALEQQIQSLQTSIAQLNATNGGNGASVGNNPGGNPGGTNGGNPGGTPDLGLTGTTVGGNPVPPGWQPVTVGVTPGLTTGNGIGNSPTATQNLIGAGVIPPTSGAINFGAYSYSGHGL